MRVEDLAYQLPEAAVAQRPVEPRDAARLLVALGSGQPVHVTVRDLADYVGPGDLLVINDTKVLPARLRLHKQSGGAVEVLLLSPRDDAHGEWEALVRPGKRVPPGTPVFAPDQAEPVVIVGAALDEEGTRCVELVGVGSPADAQRVLAAVGEVPLPPYIHEPLADPGRYQTVFARASGSVAAPTAGLHLTEDLLRRCRVAGAVVATVTLDVGLGTFRPMTAERVEDHAIHAERYVVPDATLAAIEAADRVVAIGTTALRCLESYAATGEQRGSTELFIYGDYRFRLVDRLLTNFHQPGSSLLALLDAFIGPRWRDLYALALRDGYRFLSFGDAMFVDKANR
ncbi:MAG TPA: tRNA preQ1(34) S-adenosylmethionine ribosyltransferase-isomerase QueA [Acidimicrobiales bacterium]|nr:tRNA preQ1(34) S-adenosylmethionine ribosyltransferase-isomerase QueA [Acidimicrobiales bacterium]